MRGAGFGGGAPKGSWEELQCTQRGPGGLLWGPHGALGEDTRRAVGFVLRRSGESWIIACL